MQVGPFWLITTGTLTGPWHVASHINSWYIVNEETGKHKKIGPVRMKGKNWHDEAIDVAKYRNEQHLRSLDPEELPPLLGKNDRLDEAIGRILKEEPNVPCED